MDAERLNLPGGWYWEIDQQSELSTKAHKPRTCTLRKPDGTNGCCVTWESVAKQMANDFSAMTPPDARLREAFVLQPLVNLPEHGEEEGRDVVFAMTNLLYFRGFYHECGGEGDEATGYYILRKEGHWERVDPSQVKGWFRAALTTAPAVAAPKQAIIPEDKLREVARRVADHLHSVGNPISREQLEEAAYRAIAPSQPTENPMNEQA